MSDQENLDISRVVGIIMQNPQLIEQIAGLARGQSSGKGDLTAEESKETENKEIAEPKKAAEVSVPPKSSERVNRAQLLGALKPYVSSERAKAIDSMISIADILDMMRER